MAKLLRLGSEGGAAPAVFLAVPETQSTCCEEAQLTGEAMSRYVG